MFYHLCRNLSWLKCTIRGTRSALARPARSGGTAQETPGPRAPPATAPTQPEQGGTSHSLSQVHMRPPIATLQALRCMGDPVVGAPRPQDRHVCHTGQEPLGLSSNRRRDAGQRRSQDAGALSPQASTEPLPPPPPLNLRPMQLPAWGNSWEVIIL